MKRPYTTPELVAANALLQLHMENDVPCVRGPWSRVNERDKRLLKEQLLLLERQELQVKNVLTMCMRTIKQLQGDPLPGMYYNANQPGIFGPSTSNGMPRMLGEPVYTTSSDSDIEMHVPPEVNLELNVRATKYNLHHNHPAPPISVHVPSPIIDLSAPIRRSIVSSTPLPAETPRENVKLTFDQGTQTDPIEGEIPLAHILKLEAALRRLHGRFQVFVSRAQISSEHPQEVTDTSEHQDTESDRDVVNESINEQNEVQNLDESYVEVEVEENNSNARPLHVRRVSAHTTNFVESNNSVADADEMVSIGDGNVTIPARVLNDIDWDSYSIATRQLLQAIFPRRVLATHSLTGKKSPAFANIPPKQRLDPLIINDIVNTVSMRCRVPKNSVRNCITIKCTDEAKLYRNRQRNVRSAENSTQENGTPSPQSSLESSNGTD